MVVGINDSFWIYLIVHEEFVCSFEIPLLELRMFYLFCYVFQKGPVSKEYFLVLPLLVIVCWVFLHLRKQSSIILSCFSCWDYYLGLVVPWVGWGPWAGRWVHGGSWREWRHFAAQRWSWWICFPWRMGWVLTILLYRSEPNLSSTWLEMRTP